LVLGAHRCSRRADIRDRAAGHAPRGALGGEVDEIASVSTVSIASALASGSRSSAPPAGVSSPSWKRVQALYAAFDGQPLWVEDHVIGAKVRTLLETVAASGTEGLDPTRYGLDAVADALTAAKDIPRENAATLAQADLLLSAAYVSYATDLLVGHVDHVAVSQNWHIGAESVNTDSTLATALRDAPWRMRCGRSRRATARTMRCGGCWVAFAASRVRGGWPMVRKDGRSWRAT